MECDHCKKTKDNCKKYTVYSGFKFQSGYSSNGTHNITHYTTNNQKEHSFYICDDCCKNWSKKANLGLLFLFIADIVAIFFIINIIDSNYEQTHMLLPFNIGIDWLDKVLAFTIIIFSVIAVVSTVFHFPKANSTKGNWGKYIALKKVKIKSWDETNNNVKSINKYY